MNSNCNIKKVICLFLIKDQSTGVFLKPLYKMQSSLTKELEIMRRFQEVKSARLQSNITNSSSSGNQWIIWAGILHKKPPSAIFWIQFLSSQDLPAVDFETFSAQGDAIGNWLGGQWRGT